MHPGERQRARGIDRFNDRVRMRRAQQPGMDHARQHDVIGEARKPGDLGAAVDTATRFADDVQSIARAHRSAPLIAAADCAITRAASSIASKICTYPVQRHRLPEMASRMRSRLGLGSFASSALAVIRIPGVQ